MIPAFIRRSFCRVLFRALCVAGRPLGRFQKKVFAKKFYHQLARAAYDAPEFRWYRNRWGDELKLSPFYSIDCEILAFGTYDPNLHQFIERHVKPGMVCFDMGANIGEVTLHLARKVGPPGMVYSFEPVAPVHQRLRENIQRNACPGKVHLYPLALSNTTGKGRISYANPLSENQGMGSLVNVGNPAAQLTQDVDLMTVDDFVAAHGIGRIDLMKIDIQGAEILLLEGGKTVFGVLSPDLLIEISPQDLRCLGKTSRDLCVQLESYGYGLYRIVKGEPHSRIHASEVLPDYRSSNILCTKKPVLPGS